MIQLRPYQSTLFNEIRSAYRTGFCAPLAVLPTGGGKTTLFASITKSAAEKGSVVWLVAHRAELVKQIAMTLGRMGQPHRVIAQGPIIRQVQVEQFKAFGKSLVSTTAPVLVCSVGTLVKQMAGLPPPNLIVIDEAHHLTMDSTWGRVVNEYPNAKLLPVTATPCRLDGKGLGQNQGGFADTIVFGPSMAELIEMGYLSPYKVYAPPNAIDLTGVRSRAGDFAKEALAAAVDRPTITGDVVGHYQRLVAGKRAVAFCVSVTHAQHVSSAFEAAGIPSECLDGGMDAMTRDTAIKRFEAGETLVLTSCDIISEGFDLPAIEVAILLRPTESLSLYLQQVGRALRVVAGKTVAIILDHVGNVARHGLPDEDREWALDGLKKKKRAKAEDDDAPDVHISTCPKCFSVHLPAPVCPSCGHVYPIKERELEQVEGDLVEMTADQIDALRRAKRVMQGQAQTLDQLIAQGISKSRAQKIIAAREAKQAQVSDLMGKIEQIARATGQTFWQIAGVTVAEVRRMKPKELSDLRQRIAA